MILLYVAYSVLYLCLGTIIYQDHKYRSIHISLPVLVFLSVVVINLKNDWYYNLFTNSLFSFISVFGVVVYYSIKNKKITNPIDHNLGLGDILFFVSVSPLFTIHSYLLYYTTGLIFCILLHVICARKNFIEKTIPLAGFLSIYLILFTTVNFLVTIDILNLSYLL